MKEPTAIGALITATRPSEQRECERHGPFISYRYSGDRQSSCPQCALEASIAESKALVAEREVERAAARIHAAGIPPRFADARMATLADVEKLRIWLRGALDGKPGPLVVLGQVGTGKTHFACAAARAAAQSGMSVRYTTVPRYLRAITETWDSSERKERDVHHPLVDADLLVLDEIGAGRGGENDVWRVHDLIADRYDAGKPSIFISNLRPDELRKAIGDRAYDRMREGSTQINLTGESRRKAGASAAAA